jgi:hypothetical protein
VHYFSINHSKMAIVRTSEVDVRNQNHKYGERLKLNICILFYGDNSWTVAFRKKNNFGTVRDREHIYKFYFNYYFV